MLMHKSIFMRVLFYKIHCPLMRFCNPSATRLYISGTLKLENTPNIRSTVYDVCDDYVNVNHKAKTALKSCIKKLDSCTDSITEDAKKRVQWSDNLGKELSEIKEFESSKTGYTDNEDEGRHCLCVIL